MRIIDLSLPIGPHWRWLAELKKLSRFEDGEPYQVSALSMSVHGFTHVDAPRHCISNGATIDEIDLKRCCGEAAVLDLTWVGADTPIGPDELEASGTHLRAGDIALLATGWPSRTSFETTAFWKTSPYLTREGALWLRARGLRAVGYDFPQDYAVRLLRDDENKPVPPLPVAESPAHDLLLRDGVLQIEYLVNLDHIQRPRVDFFALPLNIPGADGSPVRAIAVIEN